MALSLLCTFVGVIADEQETWQLLQMAVAAQSSTARESISSIYRLDINQALFFMADAQAASHILEIREIVLTDTVRCSFQPLVGQEDTAIIQFQFKTITVPVSSRVQSIISSLELDQVVVDSFSTTSSASIIFRTVEDARHALFRVVDMTTEYSIAQLNIIKASALRAVPFVIKASSPISVGVKQLLRETFASEGVSILDVYFPWSALGGDQIAYLWSTSEQAANKITDHEPVALSAGVLAFFDTTSAKRLQDSRIRVDFIWNMDLFSVESSQQSSIMFESIIQNTAAQFEVPVERVDVKIIAFTTRTTEVENMRSMHRLDLTSLIECEDEQALKSRVNESLLELLNRSSSRAIYLAVDANLASFELPITFRARLLFITPRLHFVGISDARVFKTLIWEEVMQDMHAKNGEHIIPSQVPSTTAGLFDALEPESLVATGLTHLRIDQDAKLGEEVSGGLGGDYSWFANPTTQPQLHTHDVRHNHHNILNHKSENSSLHSDDTADEYSRQQAVSSASKTLPYGQNALNQGSFALEVDNHLASPFGINAGGNEAVIDLQSSSIVSYFEELIQWGSDYGQGSYRTRLLYGETATYGYTDDIRSEVFIRKDRQHRVYTLLIRGNAPRFVTIRKENLQRMVQDIMRTRQLHQLQGWTAMHQRAIEGSQILRSQVEALRAGIAVHSGQSGIFVAIVSIHPQAVGQALQFFDRLRPMQDIIRVPTRTVGDGTILEKLHVRYAAYMEVETIPVNSGSAAYDQVDVFIWGFEDLIQTVKQALLSVNAHSPAVSMSSSTVVDSRGYRSSSYPTSAPPVMTDSNSGYYSGSNYAASSIEHHDSMSVASSVQHRYSDPPPMIMDDSILGGRRVQHQQQIPPSHRGTFAFADREAGIFFFAFEQHFRDFLERSFGVSVEDTDNPLELQNRSIKDARRGGAFDPDLTNKNLVLKISFIANTAKEITSAKAYLEQLNTANLIRTQVYFPQVSGKKYKEIYNKRAAQSTTLNTIRLRELSLQNPYDMSAALIDPMLCSGFINIRIKPPMHMHGIRRMALPTDVSVTICGSALTEGNEQLIKEIEADFNTITSEYVYAVVSVPYSHPLKRQLTIKSLREEIVHKYALVALKWEEGCRANGSIGTAKIWASSQESLDAILSEIRYAESLHQAGAPGLFQGDMIETQDFEVNPNSTIPGTNFTLPTATIEIKMPSPPTTAVPAGSGMGNSSMYGGMSSFDSELPPPLQIDQPSMFASAYETTSHSGRSSRVGEFESGLSQSAGGGSYTCSPYAAASSRGERGGMMSAHQHHPYHQSSPYAAPPPAAARDRYGLGASYQQPPPHQPHHAYHPTMRESAGSGMMSGMNMSYGSTNPGRSPAHANIGYRGSGGSYAGSRGGSYSGSSNQSVSSFGASSYGGNSSGHGNYSYHQTAPHYQPSHQQPSYQPRGGRREGAGGRNGGNNLYPGAGSTDRFGSTVINSNGEVKSVIYLPDLTLRYVLLGPPLNIQMNDMLVKFNNAGIRTKYPYRDRTDPHAALLLEGESSIVAKGSIEANNMIQSAAADLRCLHIIVSDDQYKALLANDLALIKYVQGQAGVHLKLEPNQYEIEKVVSIFDLRFFIKGGAEVRSPLHSLPKIAASRGLLLTVNIGTIEISTFAKAFGNSGFLDKVDVIVRYVTSASSLEQEYTVSYDPHAAKTVIEVPVSASVLPMDWAGIITYSVRKSKEMGFSSAAFMILPSACRDFGEAVVDFIKLTPTVQLLNRFVLVEDNNDSVIAPASIGDSRGFPVTIEPLAGDTLSGVLVGMLEKQETSWFDAGLSRPPTQSRLAGYDSNSSNNNSGAKITLVLCNIPLPGSFFATSMTATTPFTRGFKSFLVKGLIAGVINGMDLLRAIIAPNASGAVNGTGIGPGKPVSIL